MLYIVLAGISNSLVGSPLFTDLKLRADPFALLPAQQAGQPLAAQKPTRYEAPSFATPDSLDDAYATYLREHAMNKKDSPNPTTPAGREGYRKLLKDYHTTYSEMDSTPSCARCNKSGKLVS